MIALEPRKQNIMLFTIIIDEPNQEACCSSQPPSTVVLKVPNTDTSVGDLIEALVNHLSSGCSACKRYRQNSALFYPAQNRWLLKLNLPLRKYAIPERSKDTNDYILLYTNKTKKIKVKLPDNTVRVHCVDFSIRTYLVVRKLCTELGIRYPEELSLQRPLSCWQLINRFNHNPLLYKSTASSIGNCNLRPNSFNETSSSSLGRTNGVNFLKKLSISKSLNKLETIDTISTNIRFENYEPSSASTRTMDRYRRCLSAQKDSFIKPSKNGSNDNMNAFGCRDLKENHIVTSAQKITSGSLWLSSTKSLMEQNIVEGDLLLLKYKYCQFFNLNIEVDSIRIAQLFAQARNEIVNEHDCISEDQLYTFAGLQLQSELESMDFRASKNSVQSHNPMYVNQSQIETVRKVSCAAQQTALISKIDECLATLANQNSTNEDDPWKCSAYIRFVRLKKYTFRAYRKAYFVICDDGSEVSSARMLIYKNENDAHHKNPISRGLIDVVDLFGCQVDTNLSNAKGSNPRFIVRLQTFFSKASEIWLKFYSVDLYAHWTAALKVAARGEVLNNASCLAEAEIVFIDLRMKICSTTTDARNYSSDAETDGNDCDATFSIEPEHYLPIRRMSRKISLNKAKHVQNVVNRIRQSRECYNHLSLNEARFRYIQLWQSLPQFGKCYFTVKFEKLTNAEEILCISPSGIERINSDGNVCQLWEFSEIISWDVNWRLYQIYMKLELKRDSGNEQSQKTVLILAGSRKICQSIHEYIGGYIFVSLRFCSSAKQSEGQNEVNDNTNWTKYCADDSLFLQLTGSGT